MALGLACEFASVQGFTSADGWAWEEVEVFLDCLLLPLAAGGLHWLLALEGDKPSAGPSDCLAVLGTTLLVTLRYLSRAPTGMSVFLALGFRVPLAATRCSFSRCFPSQSSTVRGIPNFAIVSGTQFRSGWNASKGFLAVELFGC